MAVPPASDDMLMETFRIFRRQALHATCLKFLHPVTTECVEIEALPPADFQKLLDVLRGHAIDQGPA